MTADDALSAYWISKPGEDAPTPGHLLIAVAKKMTETYGPFWDRNPAPEGLRLELHPGLCNRIWSTPGFMSYPAFAGSGSGPSWEEALGEKFGVLVIVNPRLPRDCFRLVVVTEEILLGGRL